MPWSPTDPPYDRFLATAESAAEARPGVVPEMIREVFTEVVTVLHDGLACGVWRLEGDRQSGSAILEIRLVTRKTKRAIAAIEAEGRRYLRFAASDAASREVRVRIE